MSMEQLQNMKIIILVAIIIIIILGFKCLELDIGFISRHKIISAIVVILIVIGVWCWLNRISILSFIVLMYLEKPILESISKAFSMTDEFTFMLGIIQESSYRIPSNLYDQLIELYQKAYGKIMGDYGTTADLYNIIKLIA